MNSRSQKRSVHSEKGMQVTAIQPNCSPSMLQNLQSETMPSVSSPITSPVKAKGAIKKLGAKQQQQAMEQKLLPVLLLLAVLCAGPCHALRLLNDADGSREFSFGSKAAAAGAAETEPLDPSLSDDYENEISHVEFEPELGSAAPHAAAAASPVPAATATFTVAAAGPAPEPMRARNAAAAESAAGTRSMKWWLPPSTMPSFPLFPNPGGMPGIPGLPMPAPGMPFHPIGGWGVPAPPDQSSPAPPAAAASTNDANDPNANGGIN